MKRHYTLDFLFDRITETTGVTAEGQIKESPFFFLGLMYVKKMVSVIPRIFMAHLFHYCPINFSISCPLVIHAFLSLQYRSIFSYIFSQSPSM